MTNKYNTEVMSKDMEHIRGIYRLLFEVATGRRIFEHDMASLPGAFEEVRQQVNALGETLRALVLGSGTVPPYASYEPIATYVLALDAHARIVDLNITLAARLGYPAEALRHRLFESLLTSDTIVEWRRCIDTKHDKRALFSIVNLVFLANNGSILPLICTVCDALYKDWVFVLSVEVRLEATWGALDGVDATSKKDAAVIEQLHAYILANLEDAFPSISVLSSKFGIEAQQLGQGFKLYYGKSIYQFYQEERLKKGYYLILSTRLQLKEIAYRCGFSAYINFYKAFKKAYGHAPSELLRP